MRDNQITIICSCDSSYFNHMIVLVRSIIKHTKFNKIIIRGIHLTDKEINMINSYPVEFIDDRVQLPTKRTLVCKGIDANHPRMGSLRSRLVSPRTCYAVHSKFYNADLFLNKYANVLILDADTIIRDDLTSMLDLLTNHDIAISHRSRNPGGILPVSYPIFKEGVMLLRSCTPIKVFFKLITERLKELTFSNSSKYLDIDSDSEIMGEIYCKMKDKIRMLNLPDIYKDTNFTKSGIIWSGKGDRKTTKKEYVDLYNTYLK